MKKKNIQIILNILTLWGYDRFLPKPIAFWSHIILFFIISKIRLHYSIVISKLEFYSRPVKYRVITLILRFKLRHWSVVNTEYILKRWWNIKYCENCRMKKERYRKNLYTIAELSQNTNIPQYVLLSHYKDLGNVDITIIK